MSGMAEWSNMVSFTCLAIGTAYRLGHFRSPPCGFSSSCTVDKLPHSMAFLQNPFKQSSNAFEGLGSGMHTASLPPHSVGQNKSHGRSDLRDKKGWKILCLDFFNLSHWIIGFPHLQLYWTLPNFYLKSGFTSLFSTWYQWLVKRHHLWSNSVGDKIDAHRPLPNLSCL